ncbi:MAG: tripartite tricarboxylate transporter substrate binding protein [Pseudomonadota bacterium]
MDFGYQRALTRRRWLALGAATALEAISTPVLAGEGYPSRPIRVIVPFPAGGTTDRTVRALTQLAAGAMGQSFVIENKPGGSTLIAAQALMRAKSDGYTIGIVPMTLNRLRALGKTQIDAANDFSFIARVVGQTHGLVARSDRSYRSVADIVAAAKERPGHITYATSGVASITHAAMEDFADRASIQLRHVPFKGGPESLHALLGGEVDLMAESPIWASEVDSGRCRLLAIWNEQRLARYPSVPTMKELGHPLVFDGTVGLGGPAGIKDPMLARLRQVFKQAIQSTEFEAECDKLLAPVLYLDGDGFRRYALENLIQERALVQRLKFKLME